MLEPGHATAWEHFQHDAGVGIRGTGATCMEAFEQAALALTAIVTPPQDVRALGAVEIALPGCGDSEFLLLDWINALSAEMSARGMLFSRFHAAMQGDDLLGTAWGEPVDAARHATAAVPKGAVAFDGLKVAQHADGSWLAQCVVRV